MRWLNALLDGLAAGEPMVWVSVARLHGSGPREVGASMVVGAHRQADTIGGGHLEWQAIAQARQLLSASTGHPAARVCRYNLGARLGQCCGGVVWLLFEVIAPSALADWQARAAQLSAGQALWRELNAGEAASRWRLAAPTEASSALDGGEQDWRWRQRLARAPFPVWLFGAGHVAQALVTQLRLLAAQVRWIDPRDDAFAGLDLTGVDARVNDDPASEVAEAPPGCFYLVMSHSHALDFALCEAIFARRDAAYFGLIGSHRKRASFEQRLLARGLDPARLSELTCPIGIAGITDKQPAAIALAVAAQMLQLHNARQWLNQAHTLIQPTVFYPE